MDTSSGSGTTMPADSNGIRLRLYPEVNGTFKMVLWNNRTKQYDEIDPKIAVILLQQQGTTVVVMVDHPHEPAWSMEASGVMDCKGIS